MLPFLHDRLQKLRLLLTQSSEVFVKYNRLDLDFGPALTGWLDEAIAANRALGRAGVENELLALKAQLVSAEHGIQPSTGERVTSHRRAMIRSVALRVLQQSAQQLRADIAADDQSLAEARAQLRPILLLAIQKGLVTLEPPVTISQPEIDRLWRALLKEPETHLAAQQIAMQFSLFDVQLLLSDLIAAARQGMVPS